MGLRRNSLGISSESASETVCHIHGWAHEECRTLQGAPTAPLANAALIAQAPAMLDAIIASRNYVAGAYIHSRESSALLLELDTILVALKSGGAL